MEQKKRDFYLTRSTKKKLKKLSGLSACVSIFNDTHYNNCIFYVVHI